MLNKKLFIIICLSCIFLASCTTKLVVKKTSYGLYEKDGFFLDEIDKKKDNIESLYTEDKSNDAIEANIQTESII